MANILALGASDSRFESAAPEKNYLELEHINTTAAITVVQRPFLLP